MAISNEQAVTFINHLIEKGGPGSGVCPVCKNETWTVDMIKVVPNTDAWVQAATIPFVVSVCTKCFHVRHFAWLPIVEGTTNG